MSHVLKRFDLTTVTSIQTVKMPKRARILYVACSKRGPSLCTGIEEDNDTRAFDTGKHERFFIVASDGMLAPEGGVYIGSTQPQNNCYHVFEVSGR